MLTFSYKGAGLLNPHKVQILDRFHADALDKYSPEMTLTETAVFCKLPYLDILGIMLPYIVDSALYVSIDPARALGALTLLVEP